MAARSGGMIPCHCDSCGWFLRYESGDLWSLVMVTPPIDSLPDDLESLKRLLAIERAARIDAQAKAASAEAAAARAAANVSSAEALIAHLKLAIEKMRRSFLA